MLIQAWTQDTAKFRHRLSDRGRNDVTDLPSQKKTTLSAIKNNTQKTTMTAPTRPSSSCRSSAGIDRLSLLPDDILRGLLTLRLLYTSASGHPRQSRLQREIQSDECNFRSSCAAFVSLPQSQGPLHRRLTNQVGSNSLDSFFFHKKILAANMSTSVEIARPVNGRNCYDSSNDKLLKLYADG